MSRDVAPDWPTSEFDATYRVDIEGDPDVHCAMNLGEAEGHGAGHAAMAATAMRVVNAVPFVVDAAARIAELAGHSDHPPAARLRLSESAMFTLRFDMRAPAFGAPTSGAVLGSGRHERVGGDRTAASPRCCVSTTVPKTAICRRRSFSLPRLPAAPSDLLLSLVVILPFYDPVRLAEDLAVLDIISNGRASVIFGIGYRPEEYEHFGLDIHRRGRLADDKLDLLRKLLSGEQVVHEGRRIMVTPPPHTPGGPTLMWGGASLAAASRAGRYGSGYWPTVVEPGMKEAYESASREHGHEPGPVLVPDRDTPTVVFVADDVDRAWDEIGEHLLHDARMYAEWNPEQRDIRRDFAREGRCRSCGRPRSRISS